MSVVGALNQGQRMLPAEREQYRRRRSSEGRGAAPGSDMSDPSTQWAHEQMARLRSRVEAQRRDAAGASPPRADDRLSKLLDRALQGPAEARRPEAPEQLQTECATLRAALEREKDAAEELRRTLAHEAEASDGVRRQLSRERDIVRRERDAADAARADSKKAKDANAVLRSELATAHCELQRAADDLSRMADLPTTVAASDHDAAVEALCEAIRAEARRKIDAAVARERRSADAALANATDLAAADLAMALAERDVAHSEAIHTTPGGRDDGEVEQLRSERDKAREERDAFSDALGQASAQAQGLEASREKKLRVASKRADETKKDSESAQGALDQERRDRAETNAERDVALRAARVAQQATRQRLLATVVAERTRADRAKKRYKAMEGDLKKETERCRRLRAEVESCNRLPPRPPPTPPPAVPCPHTGLTPDVAHKDVDDVFADAAESILSSRASSVRATPTGSRDYDDEALSRLGAVSEALRASPPASSSARKVYRG